LAAVSNWHVFPVDPGFMLEETKEPLSFSELISMMNRMLAHGRHVEWALRAQKDCGRGVPGQRFDNKSARGTQSSEMSGPGGIWLQPATTRGLQLPTYLPMKAGPTTRQQPSDIV
jgi:hypothetical protein